MVTMSSQFVAETGQVEDEDERPCDKIRMVIHFSTTRTPRRLYRQQNGA